MAENFPSDGQYAYTLEVREELLFSLRECTNKTFLQCSYQKGGRIDATFRHKKNGHSSYVYVGTYEPGKYYFCESKYIIGKKHL